MEVGTHELSGSTMWEVSVAKGMISRTGRLFFSVQYIKVQATIAQPLNLNNKLEIEDLLLQLGNIQIRSDGLGTADYLVELIANIVPNLLRYQIMDAIERPLIKKIYEFTDKIDVEQMVKENFEEYRKTGTLKLGFMDVKVEL